LHGFAAPCGAAGGARAAPTGWCTARCDAFRGAATSRRGRACPARWPRGPAMAPGHTARYRVVSRRRCAARSAARFGVAGGARALPTGCAAGEACRTPTTRGWLIRSGGSLQVDHADLLAGGLRRQQRGRHRTAVWLVPAARCCWRPGSQCLGETAPSDPGRTGYRRAAIGPSRSSAARPSLRVRRERPS
jgi:hypothetical protein